MERMNASIYVIIPVYNSRKYLQTAVDSVLGLDLSDLYMVLVDDGSSDGSAEICDDLARKYVFIEVIHQKNAGVSAARNRGMEYVFSIDHNKDSYIVFLDADDALAENAINDEIRELLKGNYDCIGMQYAACNAELTKCEKPVLLREGEYTGGNREIRIHHTQFFASMLYRTDFLKENGIRFYPIRYSEDKIFNMQCLFLADHIYLKNHVMYLHRNSPGSAMNTREYGIVYYEPIINAYIQMDHELHEKSGQPVVQGHILARVYLIEMIREHYRFGGSKKELSEFFDQNPELYELLKDRNVGNRLLNKRCDELEDQKIPNLMIRKMYGASYMLGKKLLSGVYASLTENKRYPMAVGKLNGDDSL